MKVERDIAGRPLRQIVGMASEYPFTEARKKHRRVYLDCGHVAVTRRLHDEYCDYCRRYRRKGVRS